MEYLLHYGVLGPQSFQHLFAGGILSLLGLLGLAGELQAVKEDFAHLSGTGHIELQTRHFVYFLLHQSHFFAVVDRCIPEALTVYADAVTFHLSQHRHERHLQVLEERQTTSLLHLRLEEVLEAQGDVGIFGCIGAYVLGRYLCHADLFLARAYEFFDVDGLIVEVCLCQIVHAVPHLGVEQIMGYHGVEHRFCQMDAAGMEHLQVILHVLSYLERRGTLQYGFELLSYATGVVTYGHIPGLALPDGKAHAHQGGLHGVGAGGLGVHAELLCLCQLADELMALLGCIGQEIAGSRLLPCHHLTGWGRVGKEVALQRRLS